MGTTFYFPGEVQASGRRKCEKESFSRDGYEPIAACGSLWLGWQRAKTRGGPGLDSLHSFPDAHSFGARNGGLGAGRGGGRGRNSREVKG